jgi:uncharacterized membrane protein YqjE
MKLMKNMNKGEKAEFFAVIVMRIFGIIFMENGLMCLWILSLIHTPAVVMFRWHPVQIILVCAVICFAASGFILYFSRPFARYARRRHEIRMGIAKSI